MNLPNWFRIGWWVILLAVITAFLCVRYPDLVAGNATPADVVVFLAWVALGLAPVFQDVNLLGLRFRQELKEVKEEVSALRTEVRMAVDIRNQFSPTLALFPPVSADQLPGLAQEVKKRAQAVAGVTEADVKRADAVTQGVPEHVGFLFQTRFALERELRRIYRSRVVTPEEDRPISTTRLIRTLFQAELIDRDAAVAAEELYRIASRAIHDEDIPPVQIKFAYDVAGWLLAELKAIR